MTSAGRKISNHTVENYLEGLTDSLLMYRVGRYDVKGNPYKACGQAEQRKPLAYSAFRRLAKISRMSGFETASAGHWNGAATAVVSSDVASAGHPGPSRAGSASSAASACRVGQASSTLNMVER